MKNTERLRNVAVVIAASIIFGTSMIGTFFLYQLLDSVAVLAVACVLFAVFGAIEYWLVKNAGMVVTSIVLSMIVVFIAGVAFLGAGDGGHWLNVVSVAAFLLVPIIALVGIFPLTFAFLGVFATAFIYKKILCRAREEKVVDTDKEMEQTENTEEVAEKIEEPKTERGLWKALIPVFAIYWVYLVVLLFEEDPLLLLLPVLSVFLGVWTRKRTRKLIVPLSIYSSSTFLFLLLMGISTYYIKPLIKNGRIRYFPPEDWLLLLTEGVVSVLAISMFYLLGIYFGRMIKRLRSFNDDDAKMPFNIKRVVAYCIFILLITVIYTVFFLFNVDTALESEVRPGGIISGSLWFAILTFFSTLVFAAFALVFKIVFFKCRFSLLLLCAIIIPYVQLAVNTAAFSGPLASSVEEGGALYFVVNRDFNFDGLDDRRQRMMTKTRTESGGYYGSDIYLTWYITGKGSLGYVHFNEKEKEFECETDAEISKLKIYVEFKDSTQAENVEIYRVDGDRYELVNAKKVDARTFKISLDKDECAEMYKDSQDGFLVRYRIVFSDEGTPK